MKLNLIACLLMLFACISHAQTNQWTGNVTGITDGDTITVLNDQKQAIKIRLTEIDAPEHNQPYGEQSKQSLSEICFNKPVIVEDHGQDKYKRTLGRVNCAGTDANAEQIKRGMAWIYQQYQTDPAITALEATAQANKTGLWKDRTPTSAQKYITGPRGGCYTLSASGKKRYVDHSFCGNKG